MSKLQWYRGDERPYWEATVTVSGAVEDMTTGFTFVATISNPSTGATVLEKTVGIQGGPGGLVTVAWQGSDLDLPPDTYRLQLTASRTSDAAEWTIQDTMTIRTRSKAA